MIIHCPECNARYTLTSQQIGEHGRTMRCAKCSQTWFQPPIEDDEGVDVGAPPLAPQVGASLGQIPETISPITLVVAVLSLLAIIAGGGIWWWTGNQTPVPQNYSPVTFTGAGETSDIHTDTGLILSEIERDVIEDNNVTILLFRGKVTNTNEVTTLVPEIRVQLLNHKGMEIDFWPAEIEKKQLEPKQEAKWVVRFLNPPLDQISKYKAFFKKY